MNLALLNVATYQYMGMDSSITTEYYLAIAGIFTFLIYWYIIRVGYVVHIMQPLGNVSQNQTTIEKLVKDEKTGNEMTVKEVIKGNTGIYTEIAKKKVPFAKSGTEVNFFADPRKPTSDQNKGKSFFIDNQGVSYVHWRNRHIFFDSQSMLPIKLQSGSFQPDSHGWYKLFAEKSLEAYHRSSSTAPQKKSNTNTTLMIVFIMAFALGYFVNVMFGHQLSPALYQNAISQTVTTITSSLTSHGSTSGITETITTVSNSTTITKITVVP